MIPSLRLEAPLSERAIRHALFAEPSLPGIAAGTRIDTTDGRVAVEDLVPGQMLDTTDGPQQLLHVMRLRPCPLELCAQVELPAGLLGLARATRVAAEQDIIVTGWLAELHFGADAVSFKAEDLAALGLARRLTQLDTIDLYLPVVAQPCAVYSGMIAFGLAAKAGQPDPDQLSLYSDTVALRPSEVRMVVELLGQVARH